MQYTPTNSTRSTAEGHIRPVTMPELPWEAPKPEAAQPQVKVTHIPQAVQYNPQIARPKGKEPEIQWLTEPRLFETFEERYARDWAYRCREVEGRTRGVPAGHAPKAMADNKYMTAANAQRREQANVKKAAIIKAMRKGYEWWAIKEVVAAVPQINPATVEDLLRRMFGEGYLEKTIQTDAEYGRRTKYRVTMSGRALEARYDIS